jgi:hypothetical protein
VLRTAGQEDPQLSNEFRGKTRTQMQAILDAPMIDEVRALGADRSRWAAARARAMELHQAAAYVAWVRGLAKDVVPQDETAVRECEEILGRVLGFRGTFRLMVNVFPHDAKVWGLASGDRKMVEGGVPKERLRPDDLWLPMGMGDLEIGDWVLQVKRGDVVREVRLEGSKIKPGGRVQVWGSMSEPALKVKYD